MVFIVLIKSNSHHLECLNSLSDEYSRKYENYVFIGDFNVNIFDSSMKSFRSLNVLKNLINEATCYKNSEKPTCIDLHLQINLHYLKMLLFLRLDSLVFIYSQLLNLKCVFKNVSPHNITYQNYNNAFRSEIQNFCSLN